MSKTILIAEDEATLREALASLLKDEGYDVVEAADGHAAYQLVLDRPFDVILSDFRMPNMDGLEFLKHVRQLDVETPFILMTAFGTIENAVAAMRNGAWDFLLKPVQFEELLLKIDRAVQADEISRQCRVITEQIAAESSFHQLVSEDPAMIRLFGQVQKLSAVMSSVLLVGDSGTGKELFARAIHTNGVTRSKPFVAVNCGAIPDSLIESELFGHRRGAFTGALRDKIGFFEAANHGTIFLDEISMLPHNVQSTLLRVLEERVVVPVGDTTPRKINVRVISASNQDLQKMIEQSEFREDLYFRLNVVTLEIPPLRQRRSDIPLLVHHFLDRYSTQMNKQVRSISTGAMRALLDQPWRGNVRELENVIERAVIFAEFDELRVTDLPFSGHDYTDEMSEDLKASLRQFERQHIIYALRRHQYDKSQTALHLNIGISSLYRKMEEYEIPKTTDEYSDPVS